MVRLLQLKKAGVQPGRVRLGLAAFGAAGVLALEAGLWYVVHATDMGSITALALARTAQGLWVLGVCWGLERSLAPLGLDRERIGCGALMGLLVSLGFGVLAFSTLGVLALLGQDPLSFFRANLPGGPQLALFFLAAVLIAPVTEELVFRGLLYGLFRPLGVPAALVLTTGLFILAHNLRALPLTQAVGGVVFALAYESSGSLLTPIIVHALGNLAIYALALMA